MQTIATYNRADKHTLLILFLLCLCITSLPHTPTVTNLVTRLSMAHKAKKMVREGTIQTCLRFKYCSNIQSGYWKWMSCCLLPHFKASCVHFYCLPVLPFSSSSFLHLLLLSRVCQAVKTELLPTWKSVCLASPTHMLLPWHHMPWPMKANWTGRSSTPLFLQVSSHNNIVNHIQKQHL